MKIERSRVTRSQIVGCDGKVNLESSCADHEILRVLKPWPCTQHRFWSEDGILQQKGENGSTDQGKALDS